MQALRSPTGEGGSKAPANSVTHAALPRGGQPAPLRFLPIIHGCRARHGGEFAFPPARSVSSVRAVGAHAAKLICFDCDSTLSAVEGIDELARFRGPAVYAQVEHMTRDAMEGRIALDDIFRLRLDLIRPTRAEVDAVGALYVREVEPTARATIAELKRRGWTPVIVSGGYTQAIAPLAEFLGIERVEAVRLEFDEAGAYVGYDTAHPAARRGGKPEIIRRLREEIHPPRTVMVGDGASDLETIGTVDVFVGFGQYVKRARLEAESPHFVGALSDLLALLE